MPNDVYMTFITDYSSQLYDDLNKRRDFWTKLAPFIKFKGKDEVPLVNCILKNSCDILKKDCAYVIQVRIHDWPLLTEE